MKINKEKFLREFILEVWNMQGFNKVEKVCPQRISHSC